MKVIPPSKPRARRDHRIDAILVAAKAVFLDLGYEGASLDEVARRANASKATIYAHFGNKLGLFEAIIESVISQLPLPAQAPDNAPAADVLTKFGTAFLTFLTMPEALAFYRLIVNKGQEIPDLAHLWFTHGPSRVIGGVAAFLAERTRTGELAVADPTHAAEFFLMGLRGTIHMQALTGLMTPPFDAAIAIKVKAAVAMFIRAYGNAAPKPSPRRRPTS
jgi:AcrR family transcriptional regulator